MNARPSDAKTVALILLFYLRKKLMLYKFVIIAMKTMFKASVKEVIITLI